MPQQPCPPWGTQNESVSSGRIPTQNPSVMKNLTFSKLALKQGGLAALPIFLFLLSGCNETPREEEPIAAVQEAPEPAEVVWHIKAIHPEGRFIDVKALDADGNIYDIKAFQEAGQHQVMDVKALFEGKKMPVKILVSEEAYAPVKAIGEDGTLYDIKALLEGERLDVKGVRRAGNIIDIKAIGKGGDFYGVKAISPEGQLNDVKGVKMEEGDLEATLHGVAVHAHIKALPQAEGAGDISTWHVKAIHPGGMTLDVKALDAGGNIYDVKALQDAGQRQLMDVKALFGGEKYPVKILVSGDALAPVKALGPDGTIYDIKALTPDGARLDVKGVRHAGNIIDIKAIGSDGTYYGVKALSPAGLLNDLKGVKMSADTREGTVNGVEVHAHVKALPQAF